LRNLVPNPSKVLLNKYHLINSIIIFAWLLYINQNYSVSYTWILIIRYLVG
jgi:hypothetical protein